MTNNQGGIYEVANLGARPHDLQPHEVVDLIEGVPGSELTILSIKPGFYPTHPRDRAPLQTYMEGLVSSAELDVLCTAEATLSGVEVCELYRDVLPPNPEDEARYGVGWKRDLIKYMTGGKVFSYLIEGDDAFRKTHTLKNYIRGLYSVDETSKVVENVGHVPDPEDFYITLKILFLGGLAVETLEDSRSIEE